MGKGKKILLLIVIVALLCGGYFAAKNLLAKDDTPTETADDESVAVGAMQTDDIAGILYVSGDEKIELEKDGDTWYLKSDRSFPLKQAYADTMASAAGDLQAVRLVSESADDFAQYGLDAADTAYVFTLKDGAQVTYYIGNYNNIGSTYYMNVAGTQKIYLISGDLLDAFGYGLKDLADVEAMQTVSTENVRDMTLTLDGKTTRLFQSPDGLASVYSDIFTWFLDEQTPADATNALDLVGKAVAFTENGCADYKADETELGAYGLDAPALTAKFDYTVSERKETGETDDDGEPITETVKHDETMTLQVGSAAKGGSLYAKADGSDVVYLIDAEYLQTLRDFDFASLRSMRMCAVMSTDVESVDITVGNKTSTLTFTRTTKTDDEESVTYTLDGKEIPYEKYDDFYSAVQSVNAESVTDKEIPMDDAPIEMTFHTTRKGFETMTLRLKPFDKDFYVSQFNGTYGLLINKRDAEKIMHTFEALTLV